MLSFFMFFLLEYMYIQIGQKVNGYSSATWLVITSDFCTYISNKSIILSLPINNVTPQRIPGIQPSRAVGL